ncbi:hypothetical protein [Nitratifractor sp.]
MKVKEKSLLIGGTILLAIALTGCGHRSPVSYNVNGRYFMAGDPACVTFKRTRNPRLIQCMDAQGHPTYRRRAMTNQELLMYTHRQQMRQLQSIEAELMFSRMPLYGPWWW